jgi:hypothetical protein
LLHQLPQVGPHDFPHVDLAPHQATQLGQSRSQPVTPGSLILHQKTMMDQRISDIVDGAFIQIKDTANLRDPIFLLGTLFEKI